MQACWRACQQKDQRELLSLSSFGAVFSALAGVLLVTSEYRYGTIRPTFLFNPVRVPVWRSFRLAYLPGPPIRPGARTADRRDRC